MRVILLGTGSLKNPSAQQNAADVLCRFELSLGTRTHLAKLFRDLTLLFYLSLLLFNGRRRLWYDMISIHDYTSWLRLFPSTVIIYTQSYDVYDV